MRVVRGGHNSLGNNLAKESNRLVKRFHGKKYSKTLQIDRELSGHDLSVGKKKKILSKLLRKGILLAFSINKKKFGKRDFESLKKHLQSIRRIISKLRNINYFIETSLLEDLGQAKTKFGDNYGPKIRDSFGPGEVEALEYTAYRLIEGATILDKRLLKEYSRREKSAFLQEKKESKTLEELVRKESTVLEHLEAKIPPQKHASESLIKEPTFTHWASRVLSLLSYFEDLCVREEQIFQKLKKNKSAKAKISRKISLIISEKSKLIRILQQKAIAMKGAKIDSKFKKEIHYFTTAIRL